MKALFTLILGVVIHVSPVISQHKIPLSTFEALAGCENFNAFDTKARALGFNFDSKSQLEKHTAYKYKKTVISRYKKGYLYLSYSDYSDEKPVINFYGSSNFISGQIEKLKKQTEFSTSRYTGAQDICKNGDDKTIAFCYLSPVYNLKLSDTPIKFDGNNRYNLYKVRIFKR